MIADSRHGGRERVLSIGMKRVAIAIDLDWPLRHHHGIVSGILQAARDRGWICEMNPFLGEPGTAPARCDGVIGRAGPRLSAWARRTGTPAVNVWINSPDHRLPRVLADFAAAGRLAARHLKDRGLKRFGFLGRERDAAARLLLEGFRAGAGEVDVLLVPMDPSDAAGWRRLRDPLRRWIASRLHPVGIFASADILGRHLAEICGQEDLRIPDDVAIVGSGNTALVCDQLEPGLSSIEYGFERVGLRAAELLELLMKGRRPSSGPILVPPSGIVTRRSSNVFAVEEPTVAAAMKAIWARASKPLKISAILTDVPASRRTLERRFRQVLGRTIHDEIRRAHVELAKQLLVETSDPLKTVASNSGFRDPQQFSRVFRAAEGRTPLEFRRLHSGA
jgi:LacI family transcriptional regulator